MSTASSLATALARKKNTAASPTHKRRKAAPHVPVMAETVSPRAAAADTADPALAMRQRRLEKEAAAAAAAPAVGLFGRRATRKLSIFTASKAVQPDGGGAAAAAAASPTKPAPSAAQKAADARARAEQRKSIAAVNAKLKSKVKAVRRLTVSAASPEHRLDPRMVPSLSPANSFNEPTPRAPEYKGAQRISPPKGVRFSFAGAAAAAKKNNAADGATGWAAVRANAAKRLATPDTDAGSSSDSDIGDDDTIKESKSKDKKKVALAENHLATVHKAVSRVKAERHAATWRERARLKYLEWYVERNAAAAAATSTTPTTTGLRYCCARHDCTPADVLPLLLHYFFYATTTNERTT